MSKQTGDPFKSIWRRIKSPRFNSERFIQLKWYSSFNYFESIEVNHELKTCEGIYSIQPRKATQSYETLWLNKPAYLQGCCKRRSAVHIYILKLTSNRSDCQSSYCLNTCWGSWYTNRVWHTAKLLQSGIATGRNLRNNNGEKFHWRKCASKHDEQLKRLEIYLADEGKRRMVVE